jgi:site-specific recombinase XerC
MHYVVDKGVPLPIVQKQVGHHSLKTTSIYLSASTEKMAQAYDAARRSVAVPQSPAAYGSESRTLTFL